MTKGPLASSKNLSLNQLVRRRTSTRAPRSAGRRRRSAAAAPRVSSRYSAITPAPGTPSAPSSTRTGVVPAALSIKNSARRSHTRSSTSFGVKPYSSSTRRTKRECGQIGWWNSVNIVQRALSATLPRNRPSRMIFQESCSRKKLVPRTRSSHRLSEPLMRTSVSKAALARKQLLVSLSIPKFVRACHNAYELRNRDTGAATRSSHRLSEPQNFGFKGGNSKEAIASVLIDSEVRTSVPQCLYSTLAKCRQRVFEHTLPRHQRTCAA